MFQNLRVKRSTAYQRPAAQVARQVLQREGLVDDGVLLQRAQFQQLDAVLRLLQGPHPDRDPCGRGWDPLRLGDGLGRIHTGAHKGDRALGDCVETRAARIAGAAKGRM